MSWFIDTICFWLVKRRCAIVLVAHVANPVNCKRFDTDWLKGFCDQRHWRFEFARRIYKAQRLRITAAEARIAKKVFNLSFLLNSDGATCRKTAAAAARLLARLRACPHFSERCDSKVIAYRM